MTRAPDTTSIPLDAVVYPADMSRLIYTVSFKGTASRAIAAAFDDAQLSTRNGVTTVVVQVRDQGELQGHLGRIHALGLELLELRLIVDADGEELSWVHGP